jgi:hypothetical protein
MSTHLGGQVEDSTEQTIKRRMHAGEVDGHTARRGSALLSLIISMVVKCCEESDIDTWLSSRTGGGARSVFIIGRSVRYGYILPVHRDCRGVRVHDINATDIHPTVSSSCARDGSGWSDMMMNQSAGR